MKLQPRPVLLANRVYGLLLRAYPAAFRREYGYPMAQLFRDEMRVTLRERGPAGLLGLWLMTFVDLIKTAAAEHIWELFHLSPLGFSRRSALAAVLGAVMYYGGIILAVFFYESGDGPGPVVYALLIGVILLSLPLLALALLGLYRRLPRAIAPAPALTAAEAGLLLYIIGVVVLFTTNFVDEAMTMIPAGGVLLGLGLLGLGVIGLASQALGWWSTAPLILGTGHIVFLLGIGEGANQTVILSSLVFILLGWFLVGVALWIGPAEDRRPGLPA